MRPHRVYSYVIRKMCSIFMALSYDLLNMRGALRRHPLQLTAYQTKRELMMRYHMHTLYIALHLRLNWSKCIEIALMHPTRDNAISIMTRTLTIGQNCALH